MTYHHRFVVNAPLAAVRDFHLRTRNMAALTPFPIFTHIHAAPEVMSEGAEMRFTLWMGPLPVRWHARFEDVTPYGFRDVQVRGPFARWEHQHTFVPIDADRTEVFDTLDIELTRYPFWRAVGRAMVWGLPLLFGYRAWRTRRLLARAPQLVSSGA